MERFSTLRQREGKAATAFACHDDGRDNKGNQGGDGHGDDTGGLTKKTTPVHPAVLAKDILRVGYWAESLSEMEVTCRRGGPG